MFVQKRRAGRTGPLWAVVVFALLPSAQNVLRAQSDQAEHFTANDIFAEIGRRVPEFGGMFVDEDKDTLFVYQTPSRPSRVDDLNRAISDVLGQSRPPQS